MPFRNGDEVTSNPRRDAPADDHGERNRVYRLAARAAASIASATACGCEMYTAWLP